MDFVALYLLIDNLTDVKFETLRNYILVILNLKFVHRNSNIFADVSIFLSRKEQFLPKICYKLV